MKRDLSVDGLVKQYGYSREEAERYVKRAACKHDYGRMCESNFMGCQRTCLRCGSIMVIPGGCTPKRKA